MAGNLIIIGVMTFVIVLVCFKDETYETQLGRIVFLLGAFALITGVTLASQLWTRSEAVRQDEHSRETQFRQIKRFDKYLHRSKREEKQMEKAKAHNPEWDYDNLLAHDPKNAYIRAKRGNHYFDLGQLRYARRDYSQALEFSPHDRDTRTRRAEVSTLLGDDLLAQKDIDYLIPELNRIN